MKISMKKTIKEELDKIENFKNERNGFAHLSNLMIPDKNNVIDLFQNFFKVFDNFKVKKKKTSVINFFGNKIKKENKFFQVFFWWKKLGKKIIILRAKIYEFETKFDLLIYKRENLKLKLINKQSWDSSNAISNLKYVIREINKKLIKI